jgi:hypothetical protein
MDTFYSELDVGSQKHIHNEITNPSIDMVVLKEFLINPPLFTTYDPYTNIQNNHDLKDIFDQKPSPRVGGIPQNYSLGKTKKPESSSIINSKAVRAEKHGLISHPSGGPPVSGNPPSSSSYNGNNNEGTNTNGFDDYNEKNYAFGSRNKINDNSEKIDFNGSRRITGTGINTEKNIDPIEKGKDSEKNEDFRNDFSNSESIKPSFSRTNGYPTNNDYSDGMYADTDNDLSGHKPNPVSDKSSRRTSLLAPQRILQPPQNKQKEDLSDRKNVMSTMGASRRASVGFPSQPFKREAPGIKEGGPMSGDSSGYGESFGLVDRELFSGASREPSSGASREPSSGASRETSSGASREPSSGAGREFSSGASRMNNNTVRTSVQGGLAGPSGAPSGPQGDGPKRISRPGSIHDPFFMTTMLSIFIHIMYICK